jgi:hypothetical protein
MQVAANPLQHQAAAPPPTTTALMFSKPQQCGSLPTLPTMKRPRRPSPPRLDVVVAVAVQAAADPLPSRPPHLR